MPADVLKSGPLLLLDTCGARASLALYRGEAFAGETLLEDRTASSALLGALRHLLERQGVALRELAGVGLVSGPGSFTGVRVGLALAKGLCEAVGLPIAAVSRLAALAEAAGVRDGYAVSAAGREQVYVRELAAYQAPREFLMHIGELAALVPGRDVAVDSLNLAAQLEAAGAVHTVALTARHAFGPVLACFAAGGSNLLSLDANYVREEAQMYRPEKHAGGQLLAR